MTSIVLVTFIVGYVLVASRIAPHGAPRLWLTALAGLAVVIGGVLTLAAVYAVPDPPRLLAVGSGLLGPVVLFATLTLSRVTEKSLSLSSRVAVGSMGAGIGLAVGFVIAVVGVGGW